MDKVKPEKILFFLSISFLILPSHSFAWEETYLLSKARLQAQASTDDRYSLYMDYLFPLIFSQDQNTLLFLNPKYTYSFPHSEELNLGIGLRKIFLDEYILGINFFYDKKYSSNKARHYQRGYGLEFLSKNLDFRFNYYDPTTKAKTVDYNYSFGESNLMYWSKKEEPLEGFDFELGFPLTPENLNTRLYLGGFFYDSKLTKDKEGFRIRTEARINKWLALDLTFNTHNRGETEFIGAFIVTIPLEIGRTRDRKNPLKTTPRDYLQDRLFERVVRDIDIQTKVTEREETKQEIIYVDNNNDSDPLEDGTLSHPRNTLAEAFTDSRYREGITIYVFKGDGTKEGYTGNYDISSYSYNNITLWGSGYDGGYRGIATLGYPLIDGDGSGNIITLANNNTIMGLQIQNGAQGIFAQDVTGMNITHNTITNNTDYGVYILALNDSTVVGTLSYNTISDNIDDANTAGVVFNSVGDSSLTISLLRNIITGNSGPGIHIGTVGANGDYTMDLGGGLLGCEGYNSIYDNNFTQLFVGNMGQPAPLTIYAENNWWGTTTPGVGEIWCLDPNVTVDYDPWLNYDPN